MSLVVSEQLAPSTRRRSGRPARAARGSSGWPVRHGAAPAGVLGRFLSRPALLGLHQRSALIMKSMSGPMVGGHLGRAPLDGAPLGDVPRPVIYGEILAMAAEARRSSCAAEGRRGSRRSWPWPSRAPPSPWASRRRSVVGEVPQGLPPIKLDVLDAERVENMLPARLSRRSSCQAVRQRKMRFARRLPHRRRSTWALGAANVAAAACGGVLVQVGCLARRWRSRGRALAGRQLVRQFDALVWAPRVSSCVVRLSAVIAHAAVRLLEWETLGRFWSRRHLGSGRDSAFGWCARVERRCWVPCGAAPAVATSLCSSC